MLVAVLSGYLLALLAPVMAWSLKRAAGPLMAALPAFLFAYLLQFVPEAAAGRPWRFTSPWDVVSGLEVSFRADGLTLFFGLLITLCGAAALVGTAGVGLSAQVRERLLLALAAVLASSLGLVFADQPLLVESFAAALSLSAFLLITAEEGAEARSRFLPLLMLWFLADLALLVLFAALFTDVPGGLLGANGISVLPANGRMEPGWLVLISAFQIIPLLLVLARLKSLSAPAAAAIVGVLLPALLAILIRMGELLPFEARIALAVLGGLGALTGGAVAAGSARLPFLVSGLAGALYSVAVLEIALGTDPSQTAALLMILTGALALTALVLTVFGIPGRDTEIASLRGAFLRAPLTTLVIGLGVLACAGLLPGSGLLAWLSAANAGVAEPAYASIPVIVLTLGFCIAAALRVMVPIGARRGPTNVPRVRLPLAGTGLLLLAFAAAAVAVPGFLSRALIGPALKIAPPNLLAAALPSAGVIGGALALGGVLYWQQKRCTQFLALCAGAAARTKLPKLVAAGRIWETAAARIPQAHAGAFAAAAILIGLCAIALALAWPAQGFEPGAIDPIAVALGVIAIASAACSLFQPRLAYAVPLVSIAGLLCVLVALAAAAVDLAFVLLLILVIETVILIAVSSRGDAAKARATRRLPFARGAAAVAVGAAVILAGLEASPTRAIAEGASGITGLIEASGLALRQTGLVAIERWSGIVLLLALLGVAAADLWRRAEDES